MDEKILIADDEKALANSIAYGFKRENFEVIVAYGGEEALEKIKKHNPCVALLDINMPILSGYDVIKKLGNEQKLGIIFLTARNDIVDRVVGLEIGADDYITKPFDIREVIARVKSLIRRLSDKKEQSNEIIQIKNLKLHVSQRFVYLDDKLIDLTLKEFNLLLVLTSNLNRVFSRDDLLSMVWDMDYLGGSRTVDIHIQRIRKKLGLQNQEMIQTVHGIGYRAVNSYD